MHALVHEHPVDETFSWRLDDALDAREVESYERAILGVIASRALAAASDATELARARGLAVLAQRARRVHIDPAHAWAVNEPRRQGSGFPFAERLFSTALGGGEAPLDAAWLPAALRRLATELALGQDDLPRRLDPAAELREARALDEAKQTLRALWPEAHANVVRVLRHVVWLDLPRFRSATDGAVWGAVFIGPEPGWTRWDRVDTLLHESAHLGLVVKEGIAPLLLNPDEVASSPLRPDPRPLRGVLHAAFVLARVRAGMARALALRDCPERASAEERHALADEGLRAAVATLALAARFTREGALLYRSIASVVDDAEGGA